MSVHAAATPHHVYLNHKQGWPQHRDMPCHEMKQEQSLRLVAGQKIGFRSHFSQRQFLQLASQPDPVAHEPPGLFPPAWQGSSFAGFYFVSLLCSTPSHSPMQGHCGQEQGAGRGKSKWDHHLESDDGGERLLPPASPVHHKPQGKKFIHSKHMRQGIRYPGMF